MSKIPGILTADDLLRFLQLQGVQRLAYLDHLRNKGAGWKADGLEEALRVMGKIERTDPEAYKEAVLREGETPSQPEEQAVMVGRENRTIPIFLRVHLDMDVWPTRRSGVLEEQPECFSRPSHRLPPLPGFPFCVSGFEMGGFVERRVEVEGSSRTNVYFRLEFLHVL